MLVVTLVSTKGGCGKSTLAECLAVEAARLGRSVFIADLDPQQSTASWWRRRGGLDNPMLITGRGNVIRALKDIARRSGERDVTIIDTPSSDIRVIGEAIQAANAIIVVTQAAIKDLEAQGPVNELIARVGKAAQTIYVVNRAARRSPLPGHAADVLRDRSPHEPMLIGERIDYVRADAAGKTGSEVSAKARAEILALWKAIERIGHGQEGR